MFWHYHPYLTFWVIWLIACPLGPVLGALVKRRWNVFPVLFKRTLLVVLFTSLLLSTLWLFSPWSLRGVWADLINLPIAYMSLVVLCWIPLPRAAWLQKILPNAAGVLAMPLGLAVYTFIPFATAMQTAFPENEHTLETGHLVRLTRWGWETMNTTKVELVFQPRWLPFAERVSRRWYSNDLCDYGPVQITRNLGTGAVEITCTENSAPHVVHAF